MGRSPLGSGASVPQLASLAANAGTLSVGGGASLTVSSACFENAGTLVLAPGGVIDVPGSFTQTAAGTIDAQVGTYNGAPSVGSLAATKSVQLGGARGLHRNGRRPRRECEPDPAHRCQRDRILRVHERVDAGLDPGLPVDVGAQQTSLTGVAPPSDLATTSVTGPTGTVAVGSAAEYRLHDRERGFRRGAGPLDRLGLSLDQHGALGRCDPAGPRRSRRKPRARGQLQRIALDSDAGRGRSILRRRRGRQRRRHGRLGPLRQPGGVRGDLHGDRPLARGRRLRLGQPECGRGPAVPGGRAGRDLRLAHAGRPRRLGGPADPPPCRRIRPSTATPCQPHRARRR